MDKMSDYDYVLSDLGIMGADLTEEKIKQAGKNQVEGNQRQNVQARAIGSAMSHIQSSTNIGTGAYSDDPFYNEIVANLEDLDTIPEPPEKAKNAFAITLFCMEAAFDSRSKDFLKYAFDRFPDRDYLIVTQPHTVAENSLLQKFTLV